MLTLFVGKLPETIPETAHPCPSPVPAAAETEKGTGVSFFAFWKENYLPEELITFASDRKETPCPAKVPIMTDWIRI